MRKPTKDRKDSSAFRGKIALITGASRGIGLAIAEQLAAQGCDLVLVGRKLAPLERAGRELARQKIRVLAKVCDISDRRAVQSLATSVRKKFSRLDFLINNAGIAHQNLSVDKLPYAEWRAVIETNLTGTFLVTQAILPLMRQGSAIVNNLSIAAKRVFPGSSGYSASKHGALGFTSTLREELRPRGIRVIALLPGATDTDIWNTFWPDAPRKKMMSSATVARAVVDALLLPENSTVEELTILPTAGVL